MTCFCGSKSKEFHTHFIACDGLVVPNMESNMAYKVYVGVNYPSGDKSLEFNPETLTDVAKAIIDVVGEERDGTSFVFTIVPEKKE